MQNNKPQAIFPDMPRATPAIMQNGNFNHLWLLGFSNLFQALQRNFKNEGIMFPVLDQNSIDAIEALYTPYIGSQLPLGLGDISGQTVFDSTNRVSRQFVITYDAAPPGNILTATWRTFQYV